MNTSGKNLIGNFQRNLKITSIIFSIALTFNAASYAQSINDDLTPKQTVESIKEDAQWLKDQVS